MTGRLLRIVATAVSVIGVGVFVATPASAQTADHVAGTGHFLGDGTPAFPGVELHVNAKSGPSGEAASGTFSFSVENGPDGRGSIACINAVGNTAVIGGVIERGDTGPDGFRGVIMEVIDNGQPSDAGSDQFNMEITPNPVSSCPSPPFINAYVPIDRGNFIVHAAG